MIHGLLRRQLGDGWEHSERVGGEEEDIFWMTANAGDNSIFDEIDGIGGARVLCKAMSRVIRLTVFSDRAPHFPARSRSGWRDKSAALFLRQIDALGVASAFKIEDSIWAPAMFVVADQSAMGIGGERGFAGTGKAEEQRGVAVLSDIRGAVHGEDVARGQQIIHYAEDGFFHFAGIFGAADQDDLAREIREDEG